MKNRHTHSILIATTFLASLIASNADVQTLRISGGGDAVSYMGSSTFVLAYSAGPNGSISGNAFQQVSDGTDGAVVTAVPANGCQFINWSDGHTSATRFHANVLSNMAVRALFASTTPPVAPPPISFRFSTPQNFAILDNLHAPRAVGDIHILDTTDSLTNAWDSRFAIDGRDSVTPYWIGAGPQSFYRIRKLSQANQLATNGPPTVEERQIIILDGNTVRIIDYMNPTESLWEWTAPAGSITDYALFAADTQGAHDAELLPGGQVASFPDNSAIKIYRISDYTGTVLTTPFQQISQTSGHGLYWDEDRQILWAGAGNEIMKLSQNPAGPTPIWFHKSLGSFPFRG